MEPEPPFFAWSRADPSRSEPESAPGPWPSGARAAQKSGGSATLDYQQHCLWLYACRIVLVHTLHTFYKVNMYINVECVLYMTINSMMLKAYENYFF